MLVQRTVPHYRWAVFEELSKRLQAELVLAASGPVEHRSSASSRGSPDFIQIKVQRLGLDHKDLLFRYPDLTSVVEAMRPSALVVEANPRNLTTWRLPGLCKRVGTASVAWTKFAGAKNNPLRRGVWRAYIRRWDSVISYGESGRRVLEAYGADPQEVFVAQNSVRVQESETDLAHLRDRVTELRTRLRLERTPVLVSLGRFVPRKRFHDVIRAFVSVRQRGIDAVLYVVGAGPQESNLREVARRTCRGAGIDTASVRFTGAVPEGDDALWLSMADVAVFAGAVGLALNVSLSVGTATVVADEHGCDTELLVGGVTGVRFPRGDVRRLTQSIVDLLGDKERRERLGIEGRKEVLKRATVRHMVDGMEAAIRYAVAQKSS